MRVASIVLAISALGCGAVQRPDGGEGLLPKGSEVPELSAADQQGRPVALRGLQGQPVVVYFYPKDGTPGCTEEACAFRDAWTRYERAGVRVIGVSADDAAAHREFSQEHGLPFSLIADPEHVWSRAFGVGTFLGMTSRVSFLIGRDGRVAKVYADVDPGVHADEILKDVAQLK
ncbi:MAG: peroxiredoxin [Myxococcales bacterium]|nr:peroxiredoxin [Myxococcales bacterium]